MTLIQKYGKLALIAGGSEGIGAAAAHYLAAAGMNLVLVARRKEPLEQMAQVLTATYKVEVSCITCNLADANAVTVIKEKLQGKEINLLVYNAALAYIGAFEKNTTQFYSQMAYANMITPINLIHNFAQPMLAKGKGAIVVLASLAGFK